MAAVTAFRDPEPPARSGASADRAIDTEALIAVKRLGDKATLTNIAKRLHVTEDKARARMERLGRSGHVWLHTIYKSVHCLEVDASYYMLEKAGERAI